MSGPDISLKRCFLISSSEENSHFTNTRIGDPWPILPPSWLSMPPVLKTVPSTYAHKQSGSSIFRGKCALKCCYRGSWRQRKGLASHQCGAGSNVGVDVCWFSPSLREVFPVSRVSSKTNITKLRGTLGDTQYRNTVRKTGKYQNSVSKMDEIPIPLLWSVTLS